MPDGETLRPESGPLLKRFKNDGHFQTNLIQQERAMLYEAAKFGQIVGDVNRNGDYDFTGADRGGDAQEVALPDSIKLYKGYVPSVETPMSRFVAMSPTHDTHPWMAKEVMEASRIGYGDMESLELRRLASEMAMTQQISSGTKNTSEGSPYASSEALSVPEILEKTRMKKDVTRTRRRIAIKRSRLDIHGHTKPRPSEE